MCSCQGCKTKLAVPPCTMCPDVFDICNDRNDNIVPKHNKLVPKIGWNCKYCIDDPIGGIYETQDIQAPDLKDILADIAKLKQKLDNLLNDMDQVKTDLVYIKASSSSAHLYMKDVNGKVKNLEDRIMKLDKGSTHFYDIKQTIVNFERNLDDKKQSRTSAYDHIYFNDKQGPYDAATEIVSKNISVKDQSGFIAKVQSRLRNAPRALFSSFTPESNKKVSLLRCEV